MITCVLGRYVASTVSLVPRRFGGGDSVGGQLRGDKECPFSGAANLVEFGRRCRKAMLGGDARRQHTEHRFSAPSSKLCQN